MSDYQGEHEGTPDPNEATYLDASKIVNGTIKAQITQIEDDPDHPYKAVAAFIMAGGGAALAYADVMPIWLVIILTSLVAGVATFIVPNPKVATFK